MPTYKYKGDRPVSLPAYGIDTETGEFFEISEETEKLVGKIDHPDFERVKDKTEKEDQKKGTKKSPEGEEK